MCTTLFLPLRNSVLSQFTRKRLYLTNFYLNYINFLFSLTSILRLSKLIISDVLYKFFLLTFVFFFFFTPIYFYFISLTFQSYHVFFVFSAGIVLFCVASNMGFLPEILFFSSSFLCFANLYAILLCYLHICPGFLYLCFEL